MEFASIAQHYLTRFKTWHSSSTTQDQWSALNAILGCRTEQYDQMLLSCQHCSWQSKWRKLKGKYLFNGYQLASVFRGKMLKAIA